MEVEGGDFESVDFEVGEVAENEALGRTARALAVLLVPFVGLWEGAMAAARATRSGALLLWSRCVSVARFLGRLASATAKVVMTLLRACNRALVRLGHWVGAGLRRLWSAMLGVWLGIWSALARAVARTLAAPLRALGQAVQNLARRAMKALRRIAALVRPVMRRAVAVARRVWAGATRFIRTLVAPVRAAVRWIRQGLVTTWMVLAAMAVGTVRVLLAGIRSILTLAVGTIMDVGRWLASGVDALLRLAAGPVRLLVALLVSSARRAGEVLSAIGLNLMSLARIAGRHLHQVGLIIGGIVAGPVIVAALLVRSTARFVARGLKSIGAALVRLVRWVWRPAGVVVHRARQQVRVTVEPMRQATRAVGMRLRSLSATVRSGMKAQWSRSRQAARQMRLVARQERKGARRDGRRRARATGRGGDSAPLVVPELSQATDAEDDPREPD